METRIEIIDNIEEKVQVSVGDKNQENRLGNQDAGKDVFDNQSGMLDTQSHTQKKNDSLTYDNNVDQGDQNIVTTNHEDNTGNSSSDNNQVN